VTFESGLASAPSDVVPRAVKVGIPLLCLPGSFSRPSRVSAALACATLMTLSLLAPAGAGAAVPAPALNVSSLATPTHFEPGAADKTDTFDVRVANLGAAPTDGSDVTIVDTLPAGVEVKGVELKLAQGPGKQHDYGSECDVQTVGDHETLTCTLSESLPQAESPATIAPYEERRILIHVAVSPGAPEGPIVNRVTVQGGGAPADAAEDENAISSEPAGPGFSRYRALLTGPDGQPLTQAGAHPYQFVSSFAVHTKPAPPGGEAKFQPAGGDLKNIEVALPPGLAGNPAAALRCSAQDFNTTESIVILAGFYTVNACPEGSAVGIAIVQQIEGIAGSGPVPIYNLVPPPGMPAQLGFQVLNLPFYIDTEVHPDNDYRVVGVLHNLSQTKRLTASTVVLWGNPASPLHDPTRGTCVNGVEYFPLSHGECPAGIPEAAFLRLPTNCASPLDILSGITTWNNPLAPFVATSPGLTPVGCNQLEFEPSFKAQPTTNLADSPTGLDAEVALPQSQDPDVLGEADLRQAVVTLPKGVAVNPAGANGLSACSPAQVGLISAPDAPVAFDAGPAECPAAALIGSAEVDTPAVDHTLKGGVYVATPHQNPFKSLLAIYIAVADQESGVVVKLAGQVRADPQTGQLTTIFDEAPQQPFEDFKLHFFGGVAAALRTPPTCGGYESTAVLTPWSAPESGPPAMRGDAWAIAGPPGGGACPGQAAEQPHAPSFNAGSEAPIAGAFSPFTLHLRREDGSQELGSITVSPPPGLLAKLAGVPYCPEAALATAAAKSGADELAAASCPAASRVGTATVGAGAGPAPYYVKGVAYLAGPYKGAPLSLAIVTPAAAGPYDLGTVVVRTALQVDLETARVTAVSDPIPHILQGIPLDVRSIDLALDRPQFMLNPTNCTEMSSTGTATSILGQSAGLESRFQLGECGGLRFDPRLSLRLKGPTRRSGHPALRAELKMPAGGANIASAQVSLPRAEFLDQGNLDKVCTQPQLKSGTCPPGAVYGRAKAWSPLLDAPLEGPVYLGVGYGHTLPDLVADLNGQIRVLLHGRVDTTKQKGLRNSFEIVPDAPVSRFVLELKGGKKYGLLENSEELCLKPRRAAARFTAQNGKLALLRPRLKMKCPKPGHRNGGKNR
jgi:hypothetical protein